MKRNDFIIIGIILAIAAVILTVHYTASPEGGYAVVSVDGEVVKKLPLDQETSYTIETGDNDTNELVIEDGKAYLSEANCPDKLCVKQGKIFRKSETIVCLPHKVVISIEEADSDDASEEEIDIIAK